MVWRGAGMSLLVAVAGYALTFWAWSLAGRPGLVPQLWSGLRGGTLLMAVLVALFVASLGRIPVGALTDRYGTRVVLPCLGLVSAVAVLLFASLGRGPVLLLLAVPLGIAGTTFAAGAALVIRTAPPRRRGLWLSVFGAGMGVASTASMLSQWVDIDRQFALPLLAVALLGHAALAFWLIPDRPAPARRRVHARRAVVDLLRLPATRHLSAWYAVTFGGLVAAGLYLPAYLHHAYRVPERPATLYTAACLTLAAACRPLGGRLCQRFDPVRLLRTAFTVTAGVMLALAFHPGLAATAFMIGTVAVCLGIGSGTVQAMLGATAPPEQAGTVAGTVGAIGGLAGVLPPLLLSTTRGATGSYGIGLTMLAAVTVVAAWHLHTRHRSISAVLAFPATIALPRVITTAVVVTPDLRDRGALARTVGLLTGMATRHELVVIAPASHGADLVDGLRLHLPRHHIVAIAVGERTHPDETNLVAELLNDGAVPILLPAGGDPEPVALLVAAALGTGHILRLPTSSPPALVS